MKITSNDIGSNNSTQQAVDSKVIELLAKLASKPLLIDKLLLSKDNGLQLTVNSPEGKLQLRMPLQLAQQMQPAADPSNKNNPSVELSLNNKSQVLLKLVSQVVSSAAHTPITIGQIHSYHLLNTTVTIMYRSEELK